MTRRMFCSFCFKRIFNFQVHVVVCLFVFALDLRLPRSVLLLSNDTSCNKMAFCSELIASNLDNIGACWYYSLDHNILQRRQMVLSVAVRWSV